MMDFEPRDLDLLGRPTDISYPEETGFEPQLYEIYAIINFVV